MQTCRRTTVAEGCARSVLNSQQSVSSALQYLSLEAVNEWLESRMQDSRSGLWMQLLRGSAFGLCES